jgi:hypothetical protein
MRYRRGAARDALDDEECLGAMLCDADAEATSALQVSPCERGGTYQLMYRFPLGAGSSAFNSLSVENSVPAIFTPPI